MKTQPRAASAKGIFTLAVLSLLFSAAPPARAQYAIDWHALASGGVSSGGPYTLSGTVGQPEAGLTTLAGGSYSLEGGFWAATVEPIVPLEPPVLSIRLSGGSVILSWSPGGPGFALEETDNLAAPAWTPAPAGNPVTLTPAGNAKFYRVKSP